MIIIKGGKIHDGIGNILEDTDILIEGKTIKQIGNSIEVPEGTEVYDAKGKVVLPGFVNSLNIWGCKGPGWEDDDLKEHSDPITPHMNVVYSFDQDSMMFQRVFEYGVTSAGITPSTSNVLGGYAAVFKTYGKHPYEMLVKEKVAMISSITAETKKIYGKRNTCPMTKMGAISLLKGEITKAIEYGKKNKKEYNSKSEALLKVINKEIPLFINCNTKSEMDAIELALKDLPVNVVLTGAFGVNERTGSILKDNISIILGDLSNAMSYVNKDVDFESINKLLENGVDIAISSGGDNMASGKESLLWNAILCHKYGLKDEDVLKMITSIPAKILGVHDRIGSIEVGKDADIVLFKGLPALDTHAEVQYTIIDGKTVYQKV